MLEGLDGKRSLARSSDLATGRWWRTALTLTATSSVVVASSLVVGVVVLVLISQAPLWLFSGRDRARLRPRITDQRAGTDLLLRRRLRPATELALSGACVRLSRPRADQEANRTRAVGFGYPTKQRQGLVGPSVRYKKFGQLDNA